MEILILFLNRGLPAMREKWFKKLKKLLGEMPSDVEISVYINSLSASQIRLHERGAVEEFEYQSN